MTETSGPDLTKDPPAVAPPVAGRKQTYAEWQAEQDPWGARPPGATSGYPRPTAGMKSVTALGRWTQIMLFAQALGAIGLLFPVLHVGDLVDRLRTDPGSVTFAEATHADNAVASLSVLLLLLYVATGVVWIVWFYRIRTNVDRLGAHYQRRSTGWAIGSWFCPVVNLWFPYMIAKDVLDDTEADLNHQAKRRPLVIVWWVAFVVLLVDWVAIRGSDAATLDDLSDNVTKSIVAIVVRIVAVVPAILVVRQITAAQTARMARGTA